MFQVLFTVLLASVFCYGIGGWIDELFFRASLPRNQPTYGTGGLLWASLTLALLTLPVVIIATEEAFAAVPNSMREGSYVRRGQVANYSPYRFAKSITRNNDRVDFSNGPCAGEVAPLMLVE